MPLKRQLPRDVQALADLVAIPVRDSDWDNDIAKFVDLIDPTSHARAKPSPTVTDAGPVAGGNISMVGDIVAGRDIGRLPPAQ